MSEYRPEEFGERIRTEMEARRLQHVTELQKRLAREAPDTRGTGYTAVLQYANGHWPSEPRREIVEALGRILHVRPEYLLFGGARTELEAQREVEAKARSPQAAILRERIPALQRLPYRLAVALLDHAAHRDSLERRRQQEPPARTADEQQDALFQAAEDTWDIIAAPLSGCVTLSRYEVFDYLEAALHAQNLALRLPTVESERRRFEWAEGVAPGFTAEVLPREGEDQ